MCVGGGVWVSVCAWACVFVDAAFFLFKKFF